jgi:3-hydroxyisobutyrate dehydrogenase-like beta-hydroxyacid dehydrogenase
VRFWPRPPPGSCAIVAVVDAAQAGAVLFGPDGAAAALPAGAAVLLCPTIAPHDTEALAARLLAQGLAAIDAPMSGGPQRAARAR